MKRRLLRWHAPDATPLAHPYRDTLLVYAGLAVVIVVLAVVTGGSLGKAIVLAGGFFVLASAWSLARRRQLIREARKRELEEL